jgi:hypothetical protein
MPFNVGFMVEKLEKISGKSPSPLILPTVRTTPPQLNAPLFIYHQILAGISVFDKIKIY